MVEAKIWYKQKTFYTCLAGIVTAFGVYINGGISFVQFLEAGFPLLGIIFLRSGMKK